MVGIAILGPVRVDGAQTELAPRDQVVLAALALGHGEPVSAERLADAVWGEDPPSSWRKVVQGCVVRLRKVLGATAITTTGQGYRLDVPGDLVDARRFEHLLGRARELIALGETERAAHVAGDALSLWRGRALVELEGWGPGRVEAGRLEELRLDAEELRIDAALRAGRHRHVLADAEAGVAAAPLRERRWALLALAQYQAGRQGDALRTLHRARTLLATELGLSPGPDLVALEDAILRQDPSLAAAEVLPAPSTTCPYLGLVPYDVGDSDNYFGREDDVAACLDRLASTGVLAVVGPSGSGKSSLVRAGVAAALERDRRHVVVVTPGARPTDALTALARPGPAPVLVVDQCEEALVEGRDGDEVAQFFDALTAHARHAALVVALRADRVGQLSAHPGFARLVERGVYLLGAMAGDDLRAAVERPARQAGLLLEPGLVELLVAEVEGEPGALPLLSHALRTTWARREGPTLTVEGYRSTGGIRGAVAQSAEELYAEVPEDERSLVRDVLLRLVAQGTDGEPVRARVARRTVATDPARERLVERLVDARLLTSDDGVVELAHEAVARAWPRLRGWLAEDVEGQRLMRHLTEAADTWDSMGRPDSEVYRGARLARACEWQERSQPELTPLERAFLDASLALADTERRAVEERARHQARQNRRLRALLAGVGVLLVVALVAGLVAVRQRDRAQGAAADAEASATVAEARRLGTEALTVDHLDLSLLLAVEGRQLHDSSETEANLSAALTASPQAIRVVRSTESRFQDVVVTADGRYLAARDKAGGLFFYDALDLEPVAEVVDRAGFVGALTTVPGGHEVAAVIWSGDTGVAVVRFLDAATGEETRDPLEGLVQRTESIAVSGDGRFLATSTRGGQASAAFEQVWDLGDPDRAPRRLEIGVDAPSVAFAPDGRLLVASAGAYAGIGLTMVDPATGEVGWSDPEAHAPVAIGPDGRTVVAATGTETEPGLVASTIGTADRHQLIGRTGPVVDMAFSDDGDTVATASKDHTVAVWDPTTGEQVASLAGHGGWVTGVDIARDGTTLYSSSVDGTLIAWDLVGDRRFIRQRAADGRPRCRLLPACQTSVAPSPDGTQALYRYADIPGLDNFAVRDLSSMRFGVERSSGHDEAGLAAWAPDGRHVVTIGNDDRTARLWDPRTGRKLAERELPLASTSSSITWRPGADTIVVGLQVGHRHGPARPGDAPGGGHDQGAVVELDAETLEPAGEPVPVDRFVATVALSPDGRLLAVGLDYPAGGLQLVDLRTGEIVATLDDVDAVGRLAFTPDGSLLAAGGVDGDVTLVDPEARRRLGDPFLAVDGIFTGLEFSPDGTQMLTAGSDGAVSLWDVAGRARISRLVVGNPNVASFAWFGDAGRTIVAADALGGVWSLPSDPNAWARAACAIAGRSLTRVEWQEHIPGRPYNPACG